MNKKLFVLPLLVLLLTGCKEEKPQSSSQNDNPSSETSQSSSENGGSSSAQTQHAGTLADPFTAAEAVAKMAAAGEGVVVDNKEYYVTGTFDSNTTVNAQYHQWYGTLDETEFKISGATNDSGLYIKEEDGHMNGRTVIVKGYLELYEGEYKVGYLPAAASPTGSKYVPSLVSVSGEADEEGGGSGGNTEGEIPSDAISKTYDFTSAKSQCPAYATSEKNVNHEITVSGAAFNEVNCYNSSNTDNFMMGSNKYSADAYVSNKVAVEGNIVGLKITVPAGASGNTRFHVGFGTSEMAASYTGGDAIVPSTGSQSSLASAVVLTITADQAAGYKYFNITAAYEASSTGKYYNGSIADVVVYYK